MISQKFLIPDGIEYYTGKEAILFEELKSSTLSIFKKYKYKLVVTPIVDSLSNLTNLNSDNLKNFTIPVSQSKDLGIRADITPQIARLDYQSYQKDSSNKYAYMGDIYRETTSSFDRNNPFQIGAEFFGNVNDSVDLDLIKMCCEIVFLSRKKRIVISLNDSYFINHFLESLKLSKIHQDNLISLISMKSFHEIEELLKSLKISKNKINELSELLSLDGAFTVIKQIKQFCKKYSYNASSNINSISNIASKLINHKKIEINIDLTSIKSMDYESGFNYTFFVDNLRKPIAFGGRYDSYKYNDSITRKATGFSIDLKDIITIYEK